MPLSWVPAKILLSLMAKADMPECFNPVSIFTQVFPSLTTYIRHYPLFRQKCYCRYR